MGNDDALLDISVEVYEPAAQDAELDTAHLHACWSRPPNRRDVTP